MSLPDSQMISLNRSRQRAIYWRQLKSGEWHQTGLLPADQLSIQYYYAKGFKATKPEPLVVLAPVEAAAHLLALRLLVPASRGTCPGPSSSCRMP